MCYKWSRLWLEMFDYIVLIDQENDQSFRLRIMELGRGRKKKRWGKKKEERQCKKTRGLYSELNKTVRLSCVICLTVVFI